MPQLYIRDLVSSTVKPERALAAFTRVSLEPGETKTVSLEIKPKAMRTLDRHYHWSIEPGEFQVFLGDNAESLLQTERFRVQ